MPLHPTLKYCMLSSSCGTYGLLFQEAQLIIHSQNERPGAVVTTQVSRRPVTAVLTVAIQTPCLKFTVASKFDLILLLYFHSPPTLRFWNY